jgi:ABC-type dipeptide/oligopeptide/nickel transport system ATPase component
LNDYKIILDSPSECPSLGFRETALALKEVIEGSTPNFVIGIFGTWGSGKTTLMRAIEKELNPAKSIALQFSAWRYEKESNLIIPLLDIVREGLTKWADQNKGLRQKALATASVVGKAIYSLLAGLSLKVGLPNALEISYKANESLAQARDFARKEKEARVPRSFYHAAFRALAESFEGFLGSAGGPDRIVVFVDDLDRCLPQGALEVLEAMKLFFDLEGFIFVVGLDQGVVERSIDLKYRDESSPAQNSRDGMRQIRGADYIKKIFQVPFSLSPVAVTQLDEFLSAVYQESNLPNAQTVELRNQVTPHLRYILADAGVNPREIKRYLNAYTISIKIKPQLERNVTLALQTVAFRRDWEPVRRGLLSYRDIFIDALRRRVREHDFTAIADLDPTLTDIPESFLSYVTEPNPGAVLLDAQNLDEHIYSGEATRSSLNTLFLDAIRDVAQLTKQLRALQSAPTLDVSNLSPYSSQVSSAVSTVKQAGGARFAAISKEWTDHVSMAVDQPQGTMDAENKKQWISDEEALRRRMMNLLMETYQLGSTVTPA